MTFRPIGIAAQKVVQKLAKQQPKSAMLTAEQIERGKAMRAESPPVSWGWAACQLNCSPYVLRCALEPRFAAHHRENVRRRRAQLAPMKRERPETPRESNAVGHSAQVNISVPSDVLADRDRRMAMQPASLTAVLMGDPPAADWHKRA